MIKELLVVLTFTWGFEVNEESSTDHMLCRRCGKDITASKDFTSVPTVKALRQRNDTILMQNNTLIQLFENPEGARFEVIATKNANVKTFGEAVEEYSWFPGFSWTIVLCPSCGWHLGWKFEPKDEDTDEIFSFFGLILSNLIGSSYADSLLLLQQAYQS